MGLENQDFEVERGPSWERANWPLSATDDFTGALDPTQMASIISTAGGPTTATELGLSRDVWRKAMKHGRDIRHRWSFLDLADDAGLLDDFLNNDPQ
mgnify:CR=1 FL=1